MRFPDAERARWLADPLPSDPMPLLAAWLDHAARTGADPEPGAMTLATTDADGRPSARMVLCRGLDTERGFLVFYTNRESRKGRALAARAQVALVFFFPPLSRQVRVEGMVTRSPDAESDAYFATRPLEAKLAAWASEQSEVLSSREALRERMAKLASRFSIDPSDPDAKVPRPPHWGGYRVWASQIEFWVSREGRIHDRALYTRKLELEGNEPSGGPWSAVRLQP